MQKSKSVNLPRQVRNCESQCMHKSKNVCCLPGPRAWARMADKLTSLLAHTDVTYRSVAI